MARTENGARKGHRAVNVYFMYPALALAGIIFSSIIWTRALRHGGRDHDHRLALIYIAALCGAFIGAKLVYGFAEGWRVWLDPSLTSRQVWLSLMTGKTITGALLGGYLSVEIAKSITGYTKATGDFFAIVAPFGLLFGRIGCFVQGCCLGVPMEHHWYTVTDLHGINRWPAVPLEFLFNLCMWIAGLALFRRHSLKGQLFHVYLIAYGTFRFAHEFMRDVPPLIGPVTGYHMAALAIVALGTVRFYQRRARPIEDRTPAQTAVRVCP